MANQDHLDLLRQGANVWNHWREEHPEIMPDLANADLHLADLTNSNLRTADLSSANLNYAILHNANLSYVNLRSAQLISANLIAADITDSILEHVILHSANLSYAKLDRSRLDQAYLPNANLSYSSLTNAHLRSTNLHNVNLNGADLSGADLSGADLDSADVSEANLSGANLQRVRLVKTTFNNSTLSGCSVFGISVWGVEINGTDQSDLIITPDDEPIITVDNLEVAQFIYLLLNNKKIRDVIDTVAKKVVLILGRFTPERKAVLDAIREELRKRDFLPVLFDFDKPVSRDVHETVTTLARLARFIIADITDPKSIPQELVAIVETLPSVPVQPLLKSGTEPWGMYDHIARYPWVLQLHKYKSIDDLVRSLAEKVIAPAAAKAKELKPRSSENQR